MSDERVFIIAAVAASVLLVFGATFIPIILGFRHSKRNRELEHAERIKALEMGRPLPGEAKDQPWSMAARMATWIGAGVPIGVFVCAWLTSMMVGYHETVWGAAGVVGLSGVICGAILAGQAIKSDAATAKPRVEEDSYDVVSSRG